MRAAGQGCKAGADGWSAGTLAPLRFLPFISGAPKNRVGPLENDTPKLAGRASVQDRLELPQLTRHLPCNPSIAFHGGRMLCSYRGCNYDLRHGHYKFFYGSAPSRVPDSQNYLAELSPDLRVKSVEFLEDRHIRAKLEFADGLEDLRLFTHEGHLYALACGLNFSPVLQRTSRFSHSQMLLCRVDGHILRLVKSIRTQQPTEKNWMPLIDGGKLHLVHMVKPFTYLEDVLHERSVIPMRSVQQAVEIPTSSGSSCFMPWRGGHIGVIHRFERREGRKHYIHQILLLDTELRILRVSRDFTFEGQRIEFCAGLAIEDGMFYFSYGVFDAKAVVLRLSEAALFDAVF